MAFWLVALCDKGAVASPCRISGSAGLSVALSLSSSVVLSGMSSLIIPLSALRRPALVCENGRGSSGAFLGTLAVALSVLSSFLLRSSFSSV